jgi:sigma-B regulation protein RsbU (phosphoserine phosphatase)
MLPNDPNSAGRARATTRRTLRAAGFPDDHVERAALLVSELVTNAVVHASSDIRVRVATSPVIRVEVEDDNPRLPQSPPTHPAPPLIESLEPGGLGLAIVENLATRWGTDRCPGGKVVWFELDADGEG